MKFSFKALSLSAVMLLACCAQSAQAADTLMMATTTSTQDTGLLEYLNPVFKKETGIDLKWVAVGTGKALEIARNCDADVLLVHAPAAEIEFVNAGYGIDRRQIMYNDFVIVGPNKESFYISAGQGMMATLTIAAEKGAYAMTDRGTWIKFASKQGNDNPLEIVVQGDKALFNQYSVITVNPAKCPDVKKDLALKFEDWWVKPETQALIADYKLEGKQLFFPNAGK